MKHIIKVAAVLFLTLMLGACGNVASDTNSSFPSPNVTGDIGKLDPSPPGPIPGTVSFPQDEAPHNSLTEWWYYTGHLTADDGHLYGFEFVIFQGLRGDNPPGYSSHFAITDISANLFHYDQRSVIGANFTPGGTNGFNLALGNWKLHGLNGNDAINARFSDGTYALDLTLNDQKGPLLEGGTGLFHEGPGSDSYYYSRPQMAVNGTLTDHGAQKHITGSAWFDQQWGNFIPMAGGWDWFSTQFADNSELMLYNLRTDKGQPYAAFGTYYSPDKKTITVETKDFTVKASGSWQSPKTGVTYPSGWDVVIAANPDKGLPAMSIHYEPAVKNQELDTRGSTATIYWEGANTVTGTKANQPITGQSYVELTGYDGNTIIGTTK